MKLLMLGHGGVNQADRIEALRSLGHEVVSESLYQPIAGRIELASYKWAVRTGTGPWIAAANRNLLDRGRLWSGYDLLWVEKAQFITHETILSLRELLGCPIVHFTPDIAIAVSGTQYSQIFQDAISSYDGVITAKDFEVAEYHSKGAKNVFLIETAVNHLRFFPRSSRSSGRRIAVGLIGHCESYYLNVARSLYRSGIDIEVRGPGWEHIFRKWDPRNSGFIKGGLVHGENYPVRLGQTDIGLGLLSKLGPDVVTTRSLEIPACGTFLLAERTTKHQAMFQEGVEAEFFGSQKELLDKASYYLSHASARERIARAGRNRFVGSEYRWDVQTSIVLDKIGSLLV